MAKKREFTSSWYRVWVKEKEADTSEGPVSDVIAPDISRAMQTALAELGENYEVFSAKYMGDKKAFEEHRQMVRHAAKRLPPSPAARREGSNGPT